MEKIKKLKFGKYLAGLLVFVAVFVAAMVLAAHNNTVLGWVVAGIALGWLLLASVVVWTVWRVSVVGVMATEQVGNAFGSFNESNQNKNAVVLKQEERNPEVDEKLSHVFEIINTQTKEAQTAIHSGEKEKAERALDAITDTAHMGNSLLN